MNSYWIDSMPNIDNFKPLDKNMDTEVCIIGAGIFGLSCAYYLTKLGFKVTVLEKFKIARKTTGHTTAKITSQHGLFYDYLIHSYDESFAKSYLEANEKAILNIKNIVREENIKCDFETQKAYVYTVNESEVQNIKNEVDSLNNIGFPAKFVTKLNLPFEIKGAIQFENQAQFHPLKYVYGLCDCITKRGGKIFTDTTVVDVKTDGDLYLTYTKDFIVKSKYVILASHYPFLNIPGFYFTKMYQSTSYVIGVDTKKPLFDGMYISCDVPSFSYRTAKFGDKKLLLLGGASHKTGQFVDYANSYGILENEAKKLYPDSEILYRWDTRDCITLDKIPYIGNFSNTMPNLYIATGFNKWGMTSSNVAANVVTDKICRKDNEYAFVFDSTRVHPIKNRDEVKNILTQSVNSLFIDKIKTNYSDFDSISNDSGSIIEINGQKVGIYKDSSGNLFAVNPICTHLGCLLSWNDADKTWDCPCHGSRFNYMGKNIYDPAFKDLEIYNL